MEPKRSRPFSFLFLSFVNIAAILSIESWPFLVGYGLSSLFFLALAALAFFVPLSMVCAELSANWPQAGSVFGWVKEAFGPRTAFFTTLVVWISNTLWYPSALSFFAVTFSHVIDPTLTESVWFNFAVVTCTFALALLNNFRGIEFSGWVSSMAALLGTLIPGVLIILFGLFWALDGHPLQIELSWDAFWPHLSTRDEWVFLSGVMLTFSGIELNAAFARKMGTPQLFPKTMLLSGLIVVIFSMLGAVSIGIAIPKGEEGLVSVTIATLSHYLSAYGFGWALPLIAGLICLGAFGGISIWIAGSNQELLVAMQHAGKTRGLFAVNKHQIPARLMLIQGSLVALLSLAMFSMPDLSQFYWLFTAFSSQLYLFMYILLFASAILLKVKYPLRIGPRLIPGGRGGLFAVAGAGLLSALAAFAVSFLPPLQWQGASFFSSTGFFLIGWALLLGGANYRLLLLPFRRGRLPAKSTELIK